MRRKLVCIQGLGFVGLAMATVVANSFDEKGAPLYDVIGVDLPANKHKLDLINAGRLPFKTEDLSFRQELKTAVIKNKNMRVTTDESAYAAADIVVVDVPLHMQKSAKHPAGYKLINKPFEKAIETLGKLIKPDCVVLVETTLAPGFCFNVVLPIMAAQFKLRSIKTAPLIAHSYERVMPGKDYLNSIRNYYRAFSGLNEAAAEKARAFLSSIINTAQYPLRQGKCAEASELAKVLENSYRSVNIAFIHEWTLLAEKMGVNLFEVIETIRDRSTHRNIMEPGFGVGGYCLTKDSLLALWSSKNFYQSDYGLPFSELAIQVNDRMPLHTLDLIKNETSLKNKKIAILGVSYKEDVGDTRFSPAEILYKSVCKSGAECFVHDPYISDWLEVPDAEFINLKEDLKAMDVIVFTVRHKVYQRLTPGQLVKYSKKGALFVDTFNVLNDEKIMRLLNNERNVIGVGKGHINKMREQAA